jgi:hypothetical protein
VELMPPGSPCSVALTEGYVENVGEVLAFLRDRDVSVRGL